jgi:hypothetical protein
MFRRKLVFFVVLVGLISLSRAYAWSPFAPNKFNDCIIDGMKGVTSDIAARAVYKSCLDKFPDSAPKTSSGYVSDCAVTYSGGTFVRGKPADPSKYVGISFQHSTSLAHVPASMQSDPAKITSIIRQNAQVIKKICPDIQLD